MFKSYYVVWKHFNVKANGLRLTSLNRTMQYGNFLCRNKQVTKNKEFKSYYVVWKQEYICDEKRVELCLNRTMQYGNYGEECFSVHAVLV